ncbi:MAG: hypothetical protein K2X74_03160, partial [Acetobacteraceae bacterium]|nr:hypothetical protein [Acetobacteraceae bacterium]
DGEADAEATAQRRARLRDARLPLTVTRMPRYKVFLRGEVSERRLWRLHPQDAARRGLGEGVLAEADSGRAAALRGWVRVDPDAAAGKVALDDRGLAILNVTAGETVELRAVRALPDAAIDESREGAA